jgi:hypothetical protein
VSEGSSKRQRKEFVVDDDTATEPKTDNDIDPRPQPGLQAPPLLHKATSATILDAPGVSEGSSKQQCKEFVVDDDTATEPKTDDDIDPQPQPGLQAPPLLHKATPATILDAPSSNASSHLLGGSLAYSPVHPLSLSPSQDQPSVEAQPRSKEGPKKTKLPWLVAPVSGPVHTRLHNQLINRALDELRGSQTPQLDTHDRTGEPQASDFDEVSETKFGSLTHTPQPAMQQPTSNSRTYCGRRSHLRTKPKATSAKSTDAENDADKPNSPHLTPSQLIQRARAQAIAAKVQEVAEIAPCRRPLLATGSHPPVSRSQPHLPP